MGSNTVPISLPELLVRTGRFTRGAPGQVSTAPDGSSVLFLRSRAGDDPVRCLWRVDAVGGKKALVADPVALLAEVWQPPGEGIRAYCTDRACARATFALAGELWVLDLPDGSGDRCLAAPDQPDVEYGHAGLTVLTSTAAAEGTAQGMWWSPDGERLLVARTDWSGVPQRYPVAGGANPEVRLGIVDRHGRWTKAGWDRASFEYLVCAGWDGHGPQATVQSRDQRAVRFLAIDPLTG